MIYVVLLLAGFLLGLLVGRFIFWSKPVGSLRVDCSDPEDGPYLYLNLPKPPAQSIGNKSYISLWVYFTNGVSQK